MNWDFLNVYEPYLTLLCSLVISVIVSFREQIQEVELINKLFRHWVFRTLILILLVYISDMKPDLKIPVTLLYLILNTYVVNLPNVTSESNYTNTYGYDNDDTNKEDNNATQLESKPTTTQNENFKPQSKLMNGAEIGNILTQVNKICSNDKTKNTKECQKVMDNYKDIDNNTKEIINVYNEIISSNDENSVEKVIEKYKNIY